MNDHVELCHQNKPQKLTMPKLLENDKIPTHNFWRIATQKRLPIRIYCDAECFLVKSEENKTNHQIASIGVFAVSEHPHFTRNNLIIFKGEDLLGDFMRYLIDIENKIINLISNPLDIVNFDQHHFDSTNECHICNKTILSDEIKCANHNHLNWHYRCPAHNACNLKLCIE